MLVICQSDERECECERRRHRGRHSTSGGSIAGTHVSTTDFEGSTEDIVKAIGEAFNFNSGTGHGDTEPFVNDLRFVQERSDVQTVIVAVSPWNYWNDCIIKWTELMFGAGIVGHFLSIIPHGHVPEVETNYVVIGSREPFKGSARADNGLPERGFEACFSADRHTGCVGAEFCNIPTAEGAMDRFLIYRTTVVMIWLISRHS